MHLRCHQDKVVRALVYAPSVPPEDKGVRALVYAPSVPPEDNSTLPMVLLEMRVI